MISKKNIYNLEKTKKFFKEYPIVLLYQHNNLTVKQRIDLKTQLQSITTIKTLTVKNSLVEKISCSSWFFNEVKKKHCNSFLQSKKDQETRVHDNKQKDINKCTLFLDSKKKNPLSIDKEISSSTDEARPFYSNQLENLVQGPLFLLGCQNIDDLKNVWSILKNCSSVIFLGSQYKSQLYTHLDIQKSLELNKTIYYELFNILDQQVNYFFYNYTKETNSLFHCLSKNKD